MNTNDRAFHSILDTFSRLAFAAILLPTLLSGLRSTSAARATPSFPADVSQQIQPGKTPDGLTEAEWDTIQQAIAAAEYHFAYHVADNGIPTPYYRAPNRAQGWRVRFDETGVQVAADGKDSWTLGLSLSGYGYGESLRNLAGLTPAMTAEGDTLTYTWDDNLTEWWVNSSVGLEQGFTLRQRPVFGGQGSANGSPLVLEMSVGGTLTPVSAGDVIVFQNKDNETILRYDQLHVVDANGKTVPSQLRTSNSTFTLQIVVNDSRATYPLTIDPWWKQDVKLIAGDAAAGDRFGWSVAVDGDTAVIGAHLDGDGGGGSGSAYVFVRTSGVWSEQAKLTASDAAAGDYFGSSVAVDGDTAIIGAYGDDDAGSYTGSAYVFFRSGTAWSQQAKLTAGDAAAGDQFGRSVAVSGDTAVIGSYLDDDSGSASGSAYVFFRSGTAWSQQAKLTAEDAAADDRFGTSVAVSGDTAVIGALFDDDGGTSSGAAYVFLRSGTTWSQQAKLTAGDAAALDQFGTSVAVSAETAVVGAPYDDDAGSASGSAYVFVRAAGVWSQESKLTAGDAAADDQFGYSVAVSGDTAVVGAHLDDGHGSAYAFARVAGIWNQRAKLTSIYATAGDNFGISVAVSGDTAIVGAPYDEDAGIEGGIAYAFLHVLGECSLQNAKLTASDAASDDWFGYAVAVSGDTAVIGAPMEDFGLGTTGSAYVFVRTAGVWSQQAKLTASDAGVLDNFGRSVAVSGDTAVIGANGAYNSGLGNDSGSAYVFVRSGTTWSEQGKLTASDGAVDDWFGYSVAIDGDTAVIGANGDDAGAGNNGSAYVFVRSGTTWSEQDKLTARDAESGDYFGWSVAVSGDTAVMGAWRDDDGGHYSGSAYVFVRSGTTWIEQQKLTASDAAAGDNFGWSVAVDGDWAVIGAYGDDDGGSASGSAYVFYRAEGVWIQQDKLTAGDAAAGDRFGCSVALSGDTAVIGARWDDDAGSESGSAYVFVRTAGVWSQQVKLTAGDAAAGDRFGNSVAVSGDTAVVGAPYDDDDGSESGSVYVFIRSGTTWSEQGKLTASDAESDDRFGYSVAASGDTAVIGVYGDDDSGSASGSAYVFVRSGTTWSEQQKLTASDAAAGDVLGFSVAIDGDTAVIGAYGDDDGGGDSGSAYVFTRAGVVWSQQGKLTAGDAAAYDRFGFFVAIDGDSAVIGAPYDDDGGSSSGSAYVFIQGILWDGGGADNNWSTPLNWSGDTVPGSVDVACFGSGSSKDAVVDAAFSGTVGGVHITDQYIGTISIGRSLYVRWDYSQDGGVVTVEVPAHLVAVDGNFTHSGGVLQETRWVGSNSTVNFLQIDASNMAVQYRGVTLDTTTSGNDLGSVDVSVRAVDTAAGEYCTSAGASSPPYAGRCYTITPTNNLAANVTLWALTSEIPGAITNPSVYHFSGGTWQELTNIATNTSGSYTWVSGDTTGFSSFLIAEAGGWPTAVTLASFSATPQEGGILIAWETAIEIDTVGFNLYRSESPSGPYVRLNASLIPGQSPGALFGADYAWLDEDVQSGTTYYYKLEDVEVGGKRTTHGPISASAQVPTALSTVSFKALRSNGTGALLAGLLFLSLIGLAVARRRGQQR